MSPGLGDSVCSVSNAADKSHELCRCDCASAGGETGVESRAAELRNEFHLRRRGEVDRCCCSGSCGNSGGTLSSAHRIRTTLRNCKLQSS